MAALPRVLIVDDTPANIVAVEAVLADEGVEIVKASSGTEALRLALSGNLALVLLDVEMPGMNGYEVASILRSSARTREIPIIFLTGKLFDQDAVFRGYESGAVDYIRKPLNSIILKSKVRVFAELFQLRERENRRVASEEKARYEDEKRQLLEAENAKLQAILDNMMVGVAVLDAATRDTVYFNGRVPWMSGPETNRAFSREGERELLHGDAIARALRGDMIHEEEVALDLGDGVPRTILVGATPLRDQYGVVTTVVASFLDVSSRVAAEAAREEARQQLQHAYKMSALGEMAGSIAHEVNNPLAIIIGKSRQLRDAIERASTGGDSPLMRFVAAIEDTSYRIVKIVNGLRTISRSSDRDPFTTTPLETIVEGTMAVCGARFKYAEVELRTVGSPAAMSIPCRPSEIAQVLLNIVSNAIDAVEELETRWVELRFRDLSDAVEISVGDSGPGVPVELRDKILQPFFTTKEVGKGTGLGLSISKSIVEDHGGQLFLETEADHTRFTVRLPREPRVRAS